MAKYAIVANARGGRSDARGWAELVGTRLKTLVETGTRLGIELEEPPTIRSAR